MRSALNEPKIDCSSFEFKHYAPPTMHHMWSGIIDIV